jgi:hypothetical protein
MNNLVIITICFDDILINNNILAMTYPMIIFCNNNNVNKLKNLRIELLKNNINIENNMQLIENTIYIVKDLSNYDLYLYNFGMVNKIIKNDDISKRFILKYMKYYFIYISTIYNFFDINNYNYIENELEINNEYYNSINIVKKYYKSLSELHKNIYKL